MSKKLFAVLLLSQSIPGIADERAGTPADWPMPIMKPGPHWMVLGDRVETDIANGDDAYAWDLQGWYGGDRNRLRWKTEGEGLHGRSPEHAELQLLFSRLLAPFWEWQVGVRHDLEPGGGPAYLVAGVQGEAPYRFEVDAAFFLSEDGDLSGRFETEYDLRVTQRLVLQPRLELNAAASGQGLYDSALGLRLRYELRREFAPYIGISWSQLYAETADRARARGEATSSTRLVAGLRFWF